MQSKQGRSLLEQMLPSIWPSLKARLAAVWLKAGNTERTAELADTVKCRMGERKDTAGSVALSCDLSALYRDLKDHKGEMEMLGRAEALVESMNAAATIGGGEVPGDASADTDQKVPKQIAAAKRPPAKGRGAKAAAAAQKNQTTVSARRAKAAVLPISQLRRDNGTVPALEAAVLAQKVSSLLNRREWAAAIAILHGARQQQQQPKSSTAVLAEQAAMAACLLGQSIEQMARDAVFSVIQDSTLALPCVSGAGPDRGDRLSLSKSPLPRRGRPVPPSQPRDGSKDGKGPGFLDKLREAHTSLVEAHSIASLAGDGSTLHHISGMLQGVVILLSAASSTKPRGMSHHSYVTCAVEIARNLTWRRERRALLAEKTAACPAALEWAGAPATSDSRRSSLGFSTDMARFQRDYIDIIPNGMERRFDFSERQQARHLHHEAPGRPQSIRHPAPSRARELTR